jgi:phage-related protein
MNESYYYDRDRNIAGLTAPENIKDLLLYPSYGSSVSFECRTERNNYANGYFNNIPMSINSLNAEFNMKYLVNNQDAQRLINFIESKQGYKSFDFSPDKTIYQEVIGTCSSYNLNSVSNDVCELQIKIDVNDCPNILSWSGLSFLDFKFQYYNSGYILPYLRSEVVYYPKNTNKLNNFYYCTRDHIAAPSTSPTGVESYWTQDFNFDPSIQTSFSSKSEILQNEFKNSFIYKQKINKNSFVMPLEYKFEDIKNAETKSILHFLENKAGYRRFAHEINSIYNRPKVYICPKWTHTWNFSNSNTLSLSFYEDPLGVVPKEN